MGASIDLRTECAVSSCSFFSPSPAARRSPLLAGAKNFGTAFGIGQLCFAAMLVYVLHAD